MTEEEAIENTKKPPSSVPASDSNSSTNTAYVSLLIVTPFILFAFRRKTNKILN